MKKISICLLALVGIHAFATKDQPNILFIFTDDHATQAISAYEQIFAEIAPTPNIDRIANNGMRFDRCMVTNSICGPSRACILTGTYSHVNGFMVNEGSQFDGSQQTFPKILQKHGYQTALIGKWHLGSQPTGFDYWDILIHQGHYYNPDFLSAEGKVRVEGYCTDIVTDKTIHWLEKKRNKKQPFMLMMQHKAPHREWSPALKYLNAFDDVKIPEPETLFDDWRGRGTAAQTQDMSIRKTMELGKDLKVEEMDTRKELAARIHDRMTPEQLKKWEEAYHPKNAELMAQKPRGDDLLRWKYQRYVKDYLRVIKSVDDSVGEVMDYLEKNGLSENTIVIYSSDQGFFMGEHGWFDKRFMYDESYRTPLLIKWPGVTEPGSVNRDLVSNLDFAQTFLEMAGCQNRAERMQGASLVPLLKGERPKDWRKSHYYHYYEFPGWHMVHRHEGVYDGRYKLIHFYDLEEWELYDMQEDPQELTNFYRDPKYYSEIERLKKELQSLRVKYQVPENEVQDISNPDQKYVIIKTAEVIP